LVCGKLCLPQTKMDARTASLSRTRSFRNEGWQRAKRSTLWEAGRRNLLLAI
jgi:hypothetical protein